jgi:cyclic dehypoxanthinyl futalosine synthase
MSGNRLNIDQAWDIYQNADFHELGQMAHQARLDKHAEPIVTYVIDRNINYTNVCVCECCFCAFSRPPGHHESYVLNRDELCAKIEETLRLGGTQILMQGGHHPDLPLSFYEEMLQFIKSRYPIHVHAFRRPRLYFSAARKASMWAASYRG